MNRIQPCSHCVPAAPHVARSVLGQIVTGYPRLTASLRARLSPDTKSYICPANRASRRIDWKVGSPIETRTVATTTRINASMTVNPDGLPGPRCDARIEPLTSILNLAPVGHRGFARDVVILVQMRPPG